MEDEQNTEAKNSGNVTGEEETGVGEASPLAGILLQLATVPSHVRSTERAETELPLFDGTYGARQFFQSYDRKMDDAHVDAPDKLLRLPGYLTRQPLELFRKLRLATQSYFQVKQTLSDLYPESSEASFAMKLAGQADLETYNWEKTAMGLQLGLPQEVILETLTDGLQLSDQRLVRVVPPESLGEWFRLVQRIHGPSVPTARHREEQPPTMSGPYTSTLRRTANAGIKLNTRARGQCEQPQLNTRASGQCKQPHLHSTPKTPQPFANQVPIHPDSRPLLAFATPEGLYQHTRLPFGLKTSPQIYERAMSQILQRHGLDCVAHYFDDFIIFSNTLEEHQNHLRQFFAFCEVEKLQLNFAKCEFFKQSINFLGYTITAVYNKFIPDYARLRTPLNNLLKKDVKWVWDEKCQKAFISLKESLTTDPILHLYRESLPCQVYCDASTLGIAGILKQVHPDGKIYPVQYISRSLRSHERNYSISELECLAIVESVDKFRVYLMGRKFTIFSDHRALQWLKTIKNPSGRLFRWSLRLSSYEYEVRYIKGTQQLEAVLLSRNTFCGFLDASLIKNHQPSPSGNSSLTIDHNGLHTISRKGVTKIIIPKTLTNKLLQTVHTQYNHPGISQMTRLISAQYYWQIMSKDITQKVKTCPTCQLTKRPLGPTYGELGQPPEAKGPFDLLSLDTIAGFAKYGNAKVYLHVVVDHFSRYTWTFPSKSTSIFTYQQVLKRVLQDGSPKRLLTDRTPAFTRQNLGASCLTGVSTRCSPPAIIHKQTVYVAKLSSLRFFRKEETTTLEGSRTFLEPCIQRSDSGYDFPITKWISGEHILRFHGRVKANTSLRNADVPMDDTTTKTLFTPQEKGRKGTRDKVPKFRWNPWQKHVRSMSKPERAKMEETNPPFQRYNRAIATQQETIFEEEETPPLGASADPLTQFANARSKLRAPTTQPKIPQDMETEERSCANLVRSSPPSACIETMLKVEENRNIKRTRSQRPGEESFDIFVQRFEAAFEANTLEEGKRMPIFVSLLDSEMLKLGNDLFFPSTMKEQPYERLIQRIKLHLAPRKKVIPQRCRFLKRIQLENESVSEYLREFRHLAMDCTFGEMLEVMLRDRFVAGIKSESLQKKLLQEDDDVTLDRVFSIGVSFELAEQNAKELQDGLVAKLDIVPGGNRKNEARRGWQHGPGMQRRETICFRCGGKNSHLAPACPHKTKSCFKCKRIGHLSRVCKTGKSLPDCRYVQDEFIYSVQGDTDAKINIHVDEYQLCFVVDMGSPVTLIPKTIYEKYWKDNKLSPSYLRLRSFCGKPIKIIGERRVFVKEANQDLRLIVIDEDISIVLLGREWLKGLNLDFSRLLNIRQEKVENEIDGMVNEGILQPIEYANWAAPIVPVLKKDGSLRICGDFRCTANKAIELDKYPLPSIDEIFSNLSGNTVFSSLDLSRAYLQVRLSEEAKRVVNINTTKGLFAFKRLPYGVAVAPNKFQRGMDNLFADMSGVACYIDDILVAGKDHRDHEQKLELVFKMLQRKRFIRNIADIFSALLSPLKKNSKWNWTGEHRILFAKCKALLTNESVLAHYDATRELVLACDASSYGLGLVLSHRNDRKEETPIAFASRTLTEAKGDNRPLMHIFSPQKPIPICAASRIKRWSLKLSAFKYTVEFRKTDDNGNADALSRLPLVSKTTESLDEDQVLLLRKMSEVPFSFQDVAVETRRDKLLSIVLRNVRENNWQIPKVSQENPLCSYYRIKDELSCEFGCLQWRESVVIPQKLRSLILNDLHEMHLGMVKMKMIARRYFWWPGINKNIEELLEIVESAKNLQTRTPNGLEIVIIKDITSRTIIGHLREIFARFGLPELLVTDNGRQFVSTLMGVAERYVREFKNSLRKNQGKDSIEINLQRFLFTHRAFPQTVSKESPAELLMKRNLRSRFSNLIPKMAKFCYGPKWKRGRVMELLSSRHYLIEDEGRYVKRHINQLRPVIKKEVPVVRDLVLPGTSRDFILPAPLEITLGLEDRRRQGKKPRRWTKNGKERSLQHKRTLQNQNRALRCGCPCPCAQSKTAAIQKTARTRTGALLLRLSLLIGRLPDLQSWIFGTVLVDDQLAILASAKSRIYRHFVQVGETVEDPFIAWRRTLSRWGRVPSL
ncbi:K02A2.6-like [Cordylochernes scorpioides]|uniref:RNA-directed DNA polymerase n=1 Tax=Cordylochernes scorpioides TaxID=51811 RepID=A0ABY6LAG5_9ARAC|nr:K02A2.6-like [Cordylochernes scorpioides]